MLHKIEFLCWEDDPPLEIQIEPEAMVFRLQPGEQIQIIATTDRTDFYWALRATTTENFISLYAEGSSYDIKVYNGGVQIW